MSVASRAANRLRYLHRSVVRKLNAARRRRASLFGRHAGFESLEPRRLLTGSPTITEFAPLPGEGQRISAVVDQFLVQLSESLQAGGVNAAGTWQLTGAGADQAFDTEDDASYTLTANPAYTSGTTVSLDIDNRLHPLQPDLYRVTAISMGLVDLDGNLLDGNGDEISGDDYSRTFEVGADVGTAIETTDNNALAQAVALDMIENPVGSGYHIGFGLGTLQPTTDVDYWSFDAIAGDRIAIAVDSPNSAINTSVELRNAADGILDNDHDSGPDSDSYISYYTVNSSGSYHARVRERSSASGAYELRVDVIRGDLQIESDENYSNDSINGSDRLTKQSSGLEVNADVAGTIMAPTGSNLDEDFFGWGN